MTILRSGESSQQEERQTSISNRLIIIKAKFGISQESVSGSGEISLLVTDAMFFSIFTDQLTRETADSCNISLYHHTGEHSQQHEVGGLVPNASLSGYN